MLNFFGSLRPLLKLEEVCIDNIIFQMHYKATVFILLIFSLLVTSKQYFGDPIYCQPNDAVDENVLTTYCWIHSTFAVTRLFSGKFRNQFWKCHHSLRELNVQPAFQNVSFSCRYEKWSLTLRAEHKLQGFGKEIRKTFGPAKGEVTEKFRTLHKRSFVVCTG
jgi:hypothetical protein